MNDETPSVDEIKARLKIEVEEEPAKEAAPQADVVNELKNLGRQFAETLQTAWKSEERLRLEGEIKQGLQSFAGEIDRVFNDAKDSQPVNRIRGEASQVKEKVESTEIGRKSKSSVAQGLHWLSEELDKLAEKFTPVEKSTDEDSTTE